MSETTCPQCGARYGSKNDSCTARWHALLALDHSRQPPWGPLHGLAFATFTLQHSDDATPATMARCWESVRRIVADGDTPAAVFAELRAREAREVPPPHLTYAHAPHVYGTTIADLGSFPAESYAADLRRWAVATYDAWQSVLEPA